MNAGQISVTIMCRNNELSLIMSWVGCLLPDSEHTTYSRNNIGQKCEGNCGLWVLNEIIQKIYPENLKKIVGAVWELPAK